MFMNWSPAELVFAVLATPLGGWGIILFCKAVTKAVAEVWFQAKERHTKRLIQMSKEDQ